MAKSGGAKGEKNRGQMKTEKEDVGGRGGGRKEGDG